MPAELSVLNSCGSVCKICVFMTTPVIRCASWQRVGDYLLISTLPPDKPRGFCTFSTSGCESFAHFASSLLSYSKGVGFCFCGRRNYGRSCWDARAVFSLKPGVGRNKPFNSFACLAYRFIQLHFFPVLFDFCLTRPEMRDLNRWLGVSHQESINSLLQHFDWYAVHMQFSVVVAPFFYLFLFMSVCEFVNQICAFCCQNFPLPPPPPKGSRGCLMSPPCLESQGCHLIPLCYLLSCSSA